MSSPINVYMVILMQNDLEKAINFYQELGLPLSFHVPERWAEFMINNVKMGLAVTPHELPERHTGLVLSVDNIEQYGQQLKAKNISFFREPQESLHGIMASLKDPGNNIIDLYQPTPEKLHEAMEKAK